MNDLLVKGLERLGVDNFESKADILSQYISELLFFNPVLKLVGEKSENGIIIKHILDSASGYSLFSRLTKPGDEIADLGSGAGLPGIVLAILLEDRNFVLVERMNRRVGFLRGVVAKLGLRNVRIQDKDIKDIKENYSAITCRAFHPLLDIASHCLPLIKKDGVCLFYKGQEKSIDAELLELKSAGYAFDFEKIALDVPFLDQERTMCIIKGWRKIDEEG